MADKGRGLMQFCHRKPQDLIGKYTYQQILDYGEETIRNLNQSKVIKPEESSYNVEVHKKPRLTPMTNEKGYFNRVEEMHGIQVRPEDFTDPLTEEEETQEQRDNEEMVRDLTTDN